MLALVRISLSVAMFYEAPIHDCMCHSLHLCKNGFSFLHTELCVCEYGCVHFVDGWWGWYIVFSTWGRRIARWGWWSSMIRAFLHQHEPPRRLASIMQSPLRTSVLIVFTFCCDGIATHLCWLHSSTDYLCGVLYSISLYACHKGHIHIVWENHMLSPSGFTNKAVLDLKQKCVGARNETCVKTIACKVVIVPIGNIPYLYSYSFLSSRKQRKDFDLIGPPQTIIYFNTNIYFINWSQLPASQ